MKVFIDFNKLTAVIYNHGEANIFIKGEDRIDLLSKIESIINNKELSNSFGWSPYDSSDREIAAFNNYYGEV